MKNFSHNSIEESLSNSIETKEVIEAPLVNALQTSVNNLPLQFHIPGHTRGQGLLRQFKELLEKGDKHYKLNLKPTR